MFPELILYTPHINISLLLSASLSPTVPPVKAGSSDLTEIVGQISCPWRMDSLIRGWFLSVHCPDSVRVTPPKNRFLSGSGAAHFLLSDPSPARTELQWKVEFSSDLDHCSQIFNKFFVQLEKISTHLKIKFNIYLQIFLWVLF